MTMEMITDVDGRLEEQPIHHDWQITNKSEINQHDFFELVTVGEDGNETFELVQVVVTGQKIRFGHTPDLNGTSAATAPSTYPYQISANHLVLKTVRTGQEFDARWDKLCIEPVRPNDPELYYWQADPVVIGTPDDTGAFWVNSGVYLRTPVQSEIPV